MSITAMADMDAASASARTNETIAKLLGLSTGSQGEDDNDNQPVDSVSTETPGVDPVKITLVVGGGRYGETINYPKATLPSSYAGDGKLQIVFRGTSYDKEETFDDTEDLPTKAGTYWVTARVNGDTVTDSASLPEAVHDWFIIERAQCIKPDDVETSQNYTGDVAVTIAENGNDTLLTISLIDPDNYEWSDGTTDDVTFNLATESNSAKTEKEMTLIRTIIILTVILIALLIMANIYWLMRDKKAEKKEDEQSGYAIAGFGGLGLLAGGGEMPKWLLVVTIVLAAAIIVLAVAVTYTANKKRKLKIKAENEAKIAREARKAKEAEEQARAILKEEGNNSTDEDDDITPMPYDKEEIDPHTSEPDVQTTIDDAGRPDDFTDEWKEYERELITTAASDDISDPLPEDETVQSADGDDERAEGAGDGEIPVDVAADENAEEVEEHIAIIGSDGEVAEVLQKVDKKAGIAFVTRYRKSFKARLIQSFEESKDYYSNLKNEALSYKGAKNRLSWNYDSINISGHPALKFDVRGKTLCVYFALDPDDYADSKYKVERAQAKKYEDVPCLYRIKNPTRQRYAIELIAAVFAKYNAERGITRTSDYILPYETTEALVEKGLIKEYMAKEKYEEFVQKHEEAVRQEQAKALMIIKNRELVVSSRREEVTAEEVDEIIADDVAKSLVEDERGRKTYTGKKGIVNIDSISANFERGEVVNIDSLRAKGIMPANIGYVKVLARGALTKPLVIEAQSYSVKAVKMILLTGGTARQV